jgi:hypothetical protein
MATPVEQAINKLSNAALYIATEASIGYMAARFFTKINPMHGAALCAASCFISALMRPIFNTLFARFESTPQTRFVGELLNHGLSVLATTAIVSVAGCPLTLATGAVLSYTSIALHILFGSASYMPSFPSAREMHMPAMHSIWAK